MINQAFIAEEVVRTLASSLGLIMATPITSVIAGFVAYRFQNRNGITDAVGTRA